MWLLPTPSNNPLTLFNRSIVQYPAVPHQSLSLPQFELPAPPPPSQQLSVHNHPYIFLSSCITPNFPSPQIWISCVTPTPESLSNNPLTLSPLSVVHIPCCTTPNSPSPRVLLTCMESAGIICFPGVIYDDKGLCLCSGGEGLNVRPAPPSPDPLSIAWNIEHSVLKLPNSVKILTPMLQISYFWLADKTFNF